MNITNIGAGYAGIVTGACLPELGENVFCLDADQSKIDTLNGDGVPIHEQAIKEIIARNLEAGRLSVTTDVATRSARAIH